MTESEKVIIAISGASGMIYARRILELLKTENLKKQYSELAVIVSDNAGEIWKREIKDLKISDFGFKIYDNNDFYAPFASGSSAYDTMIVIPCSAGTLGRIASGVSENLIGRAADVMLKERKKLILVTRETPLNLIHIKNMKTVTEAGGIICPASPSFYTGPETFTELADTVTERVLDLAGFSFPARRW